jgi:gas vesicle protein
MRKGNFLMSMLAGFGVGIAASVLFAPGAEKTRRRIRARADRATDLFKKSAQRFGGAAEEVLQNGHQELSRTVNDFRDKAKDKIDTAAGVTKKAADQVFDKSRDVAHTMGKKMEDAGKRLQNT